MIAWRAAPDGCLGRWVPGRPTGYSAGANERAWKAAVAAAFHAEQLDPIARIGVEAHFVLDQAQRGTLAPDLDNLVKSTIDALIEVIGHRAVHGPPQADDERVDLILAQKSVARDGDAPGAWVAVWTLSP